LYPQPPFAWSTRVQINDAGSRYFAHNFLLKRVLHRLLPGFSSLLLFFLWMGTGVNANRYMDDMGHSSGEGVRSVGESSVPSDQGSGPSDEGVRSVGEYEIPSDEQSAPSDEGVRPVGEYTAPSDEYSSPSDMGVRPEGEDAVPSDEAAGPSDEGVDPSDEGVGP
jgi:hypothetical protein